MRRYQLAAAAALVGLSIFVGVEALTLQYYTPLGPGPGFFSFWLSICLALAAVAMGVQAWRRESESVPANFFPSRSGLMKIGAVCLSLVATMALLEWLGYRLTMFPVVALLLWVLGQRNLLITGALAAISSFGVYHVFVHFLNVPLPISSFGL